MTIHRTWRDVAAVVTAGLVAATLAGTATGTLPRGDGCVSRADGFSNLLVRLVFIGCGHRIFSILRFIWAATGWQKFRGNAAFSPVGLALIGIAGTALGSQVGDGFQH